MKKELKKENYNFKHIFSVDELEEKSKQLAKACGDRKSLEDEKKTLVSEFKAKIEGKNAEINLVSSHINTGYEYITRTCEVDLDFDKGIKTYLHEGKTVGTERLTATDHQTEIGFEIELIQNPYKI